MPSTSCLVDTRASSCMGRCGARMCEIREAEDSSRICSPARMLPGHPSTGGSAGARSAAAAALR